MRQIGTLPEERDARRLADYLLTLDITTRLDRAGDGWIVWVHQEDLVDRARRELEGFLKDPANRRYQGAAEIARARRKQAEQEEKAHARNSINLGAGQRYRPWARCRLTYALIAASVAVAVGTDLGNILNPLTRKLAIAEIRIPIKKVIDKGGEPVIIWDAATGPGKPLEEVRRGQVWRLVTPIFLHFTLLHLLFNMSWVYELGGMIEMRRGTWRLAALVLVLAITSNLGEYFYSFYYGSQVGIFGGMSGVVYGLLGYVWMTGHYEPESGIGLRPNTVVIMGLWLLLCMTGAIGPIANGAHLVGLVVGIAIGFAPHAGRELRRWI